jgi:hypothetical protein
MALMETIALATDAGTPTFFVDGERLDRPWRELAQIVPARLAATYSEGGAS